MRSSFLRFSAFGVMLTAIATIAAGDDAREAALKKDRKHIEGTWRVVELVLDGNKLPEEDARKFTVVNGPDGTWALRAEDRDICKGNSTFDPTKKPRTIDFTVTEGDGKGNQYIGIYELGEKTRKLCFAAAEKERPREFASMPGSEHTLIILERDKAK
jgi:uncharacterized protein (TIGR03067 family)